MRAWKLISVALVMAATGAAWAETVPSFPSTGDQFNNYTAGHFYTQDREQSTGYIGADGSYTRTAPTSAFVGLTELSNPTAQAFMPRTGAGGGVEDQWGIFALRVLDAGAMFAPGTPFADIFRKLPLEVTYEWTSANAMTGDTALVGIIYDGWTSAVTLAAGGTSLTTWSQGVKFELWAVDKALVNLEGASQGPHFDANWRTAQNRYTTWAAGAGTQLLSGTSTYSRFIGTQLSTTAPVFDGQSVLYMDVPVGGPGLWNPLLGGGNYYTDPNGNIADIKLTYDIDPGLDGWSVNSHDDGGFTFQETVPEPLTMLGVVLGVGGLGRYMRRRMKAA